MEICQLVSEKKTFGGFLPYMGLAAILFMCMRGSRGRGGGGGGGGGGQGLDPPWNLKILPKKGNFEIFGGLDPPSSMTKNYYFRWTPSHENFWIRA